MFECCHKYGHSDPDQVVYVEPRFDASDRCDGAILRARDISPQCVNHGFSVFCKCVAPPNPQFAAHLESFLGFLPLTGVITLPNVIWPPSKHVTKRFGFTTRKGS